MRVKKGFRKGFCVGGVLVLLVFVCCGLWFSIGFLVDGRRWVRQGFLSLYEENFPLARRLFERALSVDSLDGLAWLGWSLAIVEGGGPKARALAVLERLRGRGFASRRHMGMLYYGLARAYYSLMQCDSALEYVDRARALLLQGGMRGWWRSRIRRIVRGCRFVERGSYEVRSDIRVVWSGPVVNSEYPEYAPVVDRRERVMLFTSRRPSPTNESLRALEGGWKDPYGFLFEDIYQVWWGRGLGWGGLEFVHSLNTSDHDATAWAVSDSELVIYRSDGREWGDLYRVSWSVQAGRWQTPVLLPISIPEALEGDACWVPETGELYFSSNRPGGVGGMDLWVVRRLPDGSWGTPRNLGKVINTPTHEDGPYVTPDGTMLFFSSEGHPGFGGYDLFVSIREGGQWGAPRNLGLPMNSPDDEIYIVLTEDGRRAYFSSNRDGSMGSYDIFVASTWRRFWSGVRSVRIRGISRYGSLGVQRGWVYLYDRGRREVVARARVDSATGAFELRSGWGMDSLWLIAMSEGFWLVQPVGVMDTGQVVVLDWARAIEEGRVVVGSVFWVDGGVDTVFQRLLPGLRRFLERDSFPVMVYGLRERGEIAFVRSVLPGTVSVEEAHPTGIGVWRYRPIWPLPMRVVDTPLVEWARGRRVPTGVLRALGVFGEDWRQEESTRKQEGVSKPGPCILYFGLGRWELLPGMEDTLARWVDRVRAWWSAGYRGKIIVEGDASREGTEAYNLYLSRKRAIRVAELLYRRYGVGRDRIVIRWYGERRAGAGEWWRRVVVYVE